MKKYLRLFAIWFCRAGVLIFAALWIRGLIRKDQISVPIGAGGVIIISHPHHLMIQRADLLFPPLPASWKTWDSPIPARLQYLEFRFTHDPYGWCVWLPHWLPILLLSALPMWQLVTRLRQKRRTVRGLCMNCGYDLRASSDRCPECGAMIPVGLTGSHAGS
ncbi:MAG TPA: hypothetical protein VL282_07455 [Tepidisphaeraceae bacterium]|nr:hypothetical protein [Tepidisphaeraceae bacterium]